MWAPVLAIRNAVAVVVPLAAMSSAIATSTVIATIPVWAVVHHATGNQTTEGKHQHNQFFHDIS